jgi:hypothetical protein
MAGVMSNRLSERFVAAAGGITEGGGTGLPSCSWGGGGGVVVGDALGEALGDVVVGAPVVGEMLGAAVAKGGRGGGTGG